jgi:TatD DNase family protein
MHLIDTHAHLTFEGLIENIDAVVKRAFDADVMQIITVATEAKEFNSVFDLSRGYDNVYAAMGIHPHHAQETTDSDIDVLEAFAKNDNVVAVGETGLDFHYNFSKQDSQREIFIKQLNIAAKNDKPVIIHSRNAFEETLEILDQFEGKIKNIVFHCYSGDEQQTRLLLDRGYYISFTGIVTFKNAELARVAAKIVPADRMMLETDCPYMSPVPMRNQKINEPALMRHTAEFIAELKGIPFEDFCGQVENTSRQFFGI